MSIFGSFGSGNAAASNTTGGGLFGASSANPNPLQSQPTQQSIFGSTNTNPNNAGGAFGTNTNTAGNTGGSIFGGGNTATNNQTGATTGGGLFGNQTAPATGASLFSTNTNPSGAANTNTGNIFGTNATTQQNPLFGGTANTSAPAPAGNIFGGNSTTNTNTGGGLFGGGGGINTNTGGGLFGGSINTATNANTQQAGTTGGGLFGGAQTGAGLFGSKPATSGGLFGSAPTNTNASSNTLLGGSLFGQPQQQQGQPQQQQQSSLFGSTGGNPLFGGNKSTFQSNPGLTASSLGPPTNLLASRSTIGTQTYPSDAHAQFAKTAASIEGIYNAWNPASKDCRFQAYFYNLVNPKDAQSFGRPPNVTNDAIWEKANRENPDPTCFVPVIAIGFDDLRSRVDAQTAQATSQSEKIADLRSRLVALRTEHEVSNSSRLLRAAVAQTQIAQRIMRFVQHLHLLIPSVRSSALRPEEEKLRGMLEELEEELRRERIKGRLNELWALIGAVGASVERSNGGGAAGTTGPSEWAVVDEEGLAQIAQILGEQQAGLQHLTRILQKDQKDLGIILGSASSTKDTSGDDLALPIDTDDNLWGSTSTLRVSALR